MINKVATTSQSRRMTKTPGHQDCGINLAVELVKATDHRQPGQRTRSRADAQILSSFKIYYRTGMAPKILTSGVVMKRARLGRNHQLRFIRYQLFQGSLERKSSAVLYMDAEERNREVWINH